MNNIFGNSNWENKHFRYMWSENEGGQQGHIPGMERYNGQGQILIPQNT